jgi:hypothetical protein
MTKLFSRIQKLRQVLQSRGSHTSRLLPMVREGIFFNKKFIIAASGVSLLSVPAAYAVSAQFDTTSDTPVSNVSVDASVTNDEAKTEVKTDAKVETQADESAGAATNSNGVSGSVTINGQTTPLPENGTINKTVTNSNGVSSVSVNVNGNQSASGFSSTHIHSNSTSGSTTVNINQNSSVSSP